MVTFGSRSRREPEKDIARRRRAPGPRSGDDCNFTSARAGDLLDQIRRKCDKFPGHIPARSIRTAPAASDQCGHRGRTGQEQIDLSNMNNPAPSTTNVLSRAAEKRARASALWNVLSRLPRPLAAAAAGFVDEPIGKTRMLALASVR